MEIIKNRLRHYGEALSDTDMLEESLVIIVPDTNPDALQIIGSRASVYLQEKSCHQGVLKATGNVNCCVSYLSTEGKEPYTVTASVPFAFSKEISAMNEDDRMMSSVKLLNVSAVMVNPRKLSLKVQLQVFQRLYKCQTVEYVENIISTGDECVNCLLENRTIKTIADIIEKRLVLNDEIRLNGERINGNSVLLKNESTWISEDIKVLPNKIMVRGRVDTSVSAMDEMGGFIGMSKYSVPFSQIVECDGALPEDEVEITYSPAREEIEVFTSSDNVTTMTFAFAAVTECVIKRDLELATVRDVYSTKWEMDNKSVGLSTALTNPIQIITPVRETIALEATAEKVIDIGIVGESMMIKQGESSVGGNYYISLLCQMADGTIAACGKKLYADAASQEPFGRDGWCVAGYSQPTWEINGEGEAVISFDAVFNCFEGSDSPIEIVSQCALDKNRAKESEIKASLIIKSADKSESVWEIAKAYNTSPSVIASANKIGINDEISAGRLILIPFVNR